MAVRTARIIVSLLAALAFTISLLIGFTFFPNLSLNNDEAVYVLQAQMYGQGDVTLSDSAHGDAFRPWMSGRVDGDRLVLVAQPTIPALMALSEALFGTMRIAIAAVAAAAVVAVYALTNALLRDLRIAVVAAACFVLSPLVMVQSAMFVSYVLAVSLAAASLALLTRGLDRQTADHPYRLWLTGAGLFEGLLLCTRPLEGIILAAVVVAWCLLRSANLRRAVHAIVWVGVASLPVLLIALLYNAFTTGDPFTFALWTIGGDDSFGFGKRAIAEHSKFIDVGVSEAWLALRVNLRAFPHWIVGGLLSVPLAAWGASRLWSISRPVFWLVIVQLCLTPFAYFFYYGNYLIIGGRNFYGPHYYLSLLLPTMVLLAVALVDLAGRQRFVLPCVIGAMVLGMAIEVPDKIRVNLEARDAIAAEVELVESTVVEPAIVLIPIGSDGPYVLHPWGAFANPPGLNADTLFAVDLGARNAELFARFPDRRFYRFDATREDLSGTRPGSGSAPFLEPLTPIAGDRMMFTASAPRIERVVVDEQSVDCLASSVRTEILVTADSTTVTGCASEVVTLSQPSNEVKILARSPERTVIARVPIGRLSPLDTLTESTPTFMTFTPPLFILVGDNATFTPVPSTEAPWFDVKVASN